MRRQRGLVGVIALATLVSVGGIASTASARVTTEESASILVFPKVVADGNRDTIIQITNTSNNMRHAHCFYVNAAPTDPDRPISLNESDYNPPLWTETDFDIWLTKQQPTHWVVSQGRRFDPTDATCLNAANNSANNCDPNTSGTGDADCCDAGFDPGRIPPTAPDFIGELKCIEVDASGYPVPGNSLKGEATIVEPGNETDVSKYSALGLKGFDTNNANNTLCIGGDPDLGDCASGAEYEACPKTWVLTHAADGAPNPVLDANNIDGSDTTTSLTVVPCTQNFETQDPQTVTLQFEIWNEFEERLSASTKFQCWASYTLNGDEADTSNYYGGISAAFERGSAGSDLLKTNMRAVGNLGVMAVLEETVSSSAGLSRSAHNPHSSFEDVTGSDRIVIPGEQIVIPEP